MSSTMGYDNRGGYTVGYGRPPLHSRFRKGQSGNPSGRPHGAKSIESLLQKVLDETVVVAAIGRRRRRVTKREAIVAGLVDRALQFDPRAVRLLLDMMLKIQSTTTPDDDDSDDNKEDPRERLIREFDRLAAELERKNAAAQSLISTEKAPAE